MSVNTTGTTTVTTERWSRPAWATRVVEDGPVEVEFSRPAVSEVAVYGHDNVLAMREVSLTRTDSIVVDGETATVTVETGNVEVFFDGITMPLAAADHLHDALGELLAAVGADQ